MDIKNKTNVFSENRGTVIFVVILAVILIMLFGVLYFLKQRDLGEGTPGAVKEKVIRSKGKSLSALIELTSAPEKNPDIKPQPDLTIMTSAPDNVITTKTDFEFMNNLTAPRSQ